jgi:GGDEF domain-containing protein
MEFSMTEEKDLFSTDDDSISIDSNHAHLQRRFNLERRENTKKAAILELDLDLDEFNAMNTNSFSDSEELLRQIGERLRHRLRDNDVVLPVTDDKFMVLLEDSHQIMRITLLTNC